MLAVFSLRRTFWRISVVSSKWQRACFRYLDQRKRRYRAKIERRKWQSLGYKPAVNLAFYLGQVMTGVKQPLKDQLIEAFVIQSLHSKELSRLSHEEEEQHWRSVLQLMRQIYHSKGDSTRPFAYYWSACLQQMTTNINSRFGEEKLDV